jgi:hypothetical protein
MVRAPRPNSARPTSSVGPEPMDVDSEADDSPRHPLVDVAEPDDDGSSVLICEPVHLDPDDDDALDQDDDEDGVVVQPLLVYSSDDEPAIPRAARAPRRATSPPSVSPPAPQVPARPVRLWIAFLNFLLLYSLSGTHGSQKGARAASDVQVVHRPSSSPIARPPAPAPSVR